MSAEISWLVAILIAFLGYSIWSVSLDFVWVRHLLNNISTGGSFFDFISGRDQYRNNEINAEFTVLTWILTAAAVVGVIYLVVVATNGTGTPTLGPARSAELRPSVSGSSRESHKMAAHKTETHKPISHAGAKHLHHHPHVSIAGSEHKR